MKNKNILIAVESEISVGDFHYMEDFVMDYTSPSVFEQLLEDVPEAEVERTYRSYVVQEFLRESILRGRSQQE